MTEITSLTCGDVVLLGAGVDTLEVTPLNSLPIPAAVEGAANVAASGHKAVPVAWHDRTGVEWTLEVHPGGGRGSSWVLLTSRDFDVRLSRTSSRPSLVRIHAECLWALGPQRAARVVLEAVRDLLEPEGVEGRQAEDFAQWRVARADLCADLHVALDASATPRWRRRARTWALERSEGRKGRPPRMLDDSTDNPMHGVGKNFTGWSFGRGGVMSARIYLKSLQAESHAPWIFDLWRRVPAYAPGRAVWRVEFQIRRVALKQLGADSLADLFQKQEPIWRYCTARWLWLSKSQHHTYAAAVSAGWRWLSERAFSPESLSVVEPAERIPSDRFDLKRGLAQLRGLCASAAAAAIRLGHLNVADLDTLDPSELLPPALWRTCQALEESGELERRDLIAAVREHLSRKTPWAQGAHERRLALA